MTAAGTPPGRGFVASAPGRLQLGGAEGDRRLSVALDRRAVCRVEPAAGGVAVEPGDALAEQALRLLEAPAGWRAVTEWKLPAGSGIEADAALALAATAAVARALGRRIEGEALVGLAREAARRAGRPDEHGFHAALWGGLVLTRAASGGIEAERPAADPARIEESLMVIDLGEAVADDAGTAPARSGSGAADAGLAGAMAEALASGRYEEVVALFAAEAGSAPAGTPRRRVVELVLEAGGAARPLGTRGLVAVWAPPGARGPGPREAVLAALAAARLRALPVRVDLRGLELD